MGQVNPLRRIGVGFGAAAMVLVSVWACAALLVVDVGVGYGTVDLNVKMLKAIPLDRELTAEGRVIRLSRTIGVSRRSPQRRRGNAVRPRPRRRRQKVSDRGPPGSRCDIGGSGVAPGEICVDDFDESVAPEARLVAAVHDVHRQGA